eukprot:6645684-Prymnesium_polylepis.1
MPSRPATSHAAKSGRLATRPDPAEPRGWAAEPLSKGAQSIERPVTSEAASRGARNDGSRHDLAPLLSRRPLGSSGDVPSSDAPRVLSLLVPSSSGNEITLEESIRRATDKSARRAAPTRPQTA